jgi:hypothetical protein
VPRDDRKEGDTVSEHTSESGVERRRGKLDTGLFVASIVCIVLAVVPLYASLHDIAAYNMLKSGELIGPGDCCSSDLMAWGRTHLFGGTTSAVQEMAMMSLLPGLGFGLPLVGVILAALRWPRRRGKGTVILLAAQVLLLVAGTYGFYRYVVHTDPFHFRTEMPEDEAPEGWEDAYE